MNPAYIWIGCCVGSYLVGAIPTGLLVTRAKGIDIRKVGSGNIGATNVFRALGRGWGSFTLLMDMLKGFVPAFFLPMLVRSQLGADLGDPLALACAGCAIAGHNWPVYLLFKGGKGVATSAGSLLAVAPAAIGLGFLAWLIIFAATRYVSLASITAAVGICAGGWIFYREDGLLLPIVFTALSLILVWRHRANVGRLIKGTENRIGSSAADAKEAGDD